MEKRETGVGAIILCDIAMSYFPYCRRRKFRISCPGGYVHQRKVDGAAEECGWHPRQRILSPRHGSASFLI